MPLKCEKGERFDKSVCHHISCPKVLKPNSAILHGFTNDMEPDIDILGSRGSRSINGGFGVVIALRLTPFISIVSGGFGINACNIRRSQDAS